MPEDSDEPGAKPAVSWDEISPESLRQSALHSEDSNEVEVDDSLSVVGMAWFEVILGVLMGIASMMALWYFTDGGLALILPIPAVALGTPLVLTKRRDLRYLGYGMLASIPIAFVLGMLLWYLTLFV